MSCIFHLRANPDVNIRPLFIFILSLLVIRITMNLCHDFSENLISTVEQFPILYNIRLKEYHNKDLVANAWTKVMEQIMQDWYTMDVKERLLKCKYSFFALLTYIHVIRWQSYIS